MNHKKKVILTGGTGLLGGTAAIKMSEKWDLTLWTRGYTSAFENTLSEAVKLDSPQDIGAALDRNKPDFLIHAAGMTSVEECEKDQYKAYISNVLTTKYLARACNERGIQFIYISSDHVGTDKESGTEEEVSIPVNIYAKTKLEGEFETLRANEKNLVLRTNFYAWGNSHRKSFLDHIVDNIRSKQSITLFEDVRFNPMSAEILLESINSLIQSECTGVYNLVSDDKITKYDFGIMVADVFTLDSSYIKKGRISEKKELVKRPFNLTLDNNKLKSSIQTSNLPSLRECLEKLKSEESSTKEILFSKIKPLPGKNAINYGKQWIDEADYESVMNCLASNWLTQGPKVHEFEAEVAKLTGAKYAVAMANWTCGLHMAVLAAGVGPGDYVITSPLSFVASSNCAIYAGATPIFVDIDPETLNLDPVKLDKACEKLGSRLKAIIPVHFTGAPCDMEAISAVAKKYKVTLIEDAAHALGGRYLTGEMIGNGRYSEMIGFSFHPVKNITTGEGGMIMTDSEDIYRKLLRIRSHGISKEGDVFKNTKSAFTNGVKNPWYYEMQEIGFNFRITDLQCALGLSQINKLPTFHSNRVRIAKIYDLEFSKLKNIQVLQAKNRTISGNHLYVARVNFTALGVSRAELYESFREKGIHLHLHYIPIYRQPFYEENYPVDMNEFLSTEKYYEEAVTFPLFSSMTESEMNRVIEATRTIIG